MLQSLHPIANLTAYFSLFFCLTTVLILEGDLDGLPPRYICKVKVYMLWQVVSPQFCNPRGLELSLGLAHAVYSVELSRWSLLMS